MIITVTTSTVTTITTIAAMGLTAAFSVIAVAALIGFLTTKELASASRSSSPQSVARFSSIGIIPLVMAFVVIVAVQFAELLA